VRAAIDRAGNLYATYFNFPAQYGGVIEWIGATGTPRDLGIPLVLPATVHTTGTGALVLCDDRGPNQHGCFGVLRDGRVVARFADVHGAGDAVLNHWEARAFVASHGYLSLWTYPGVDKQPLKWLSMCTCSSGGIATSPSAPAGAPF
jgi:hypothetical protein